MDGEEGESVFVISNPQGVFGEVAATLVGPVLGSTSRVNFWNSTVMSVPKL